MPILKRPIIAMDIKLMHYQNSETGETVGVSQYRTKFAFRDKYFITNRYVDAVYEAGGLPLLMPCFTETDVVKEYVGLADGFLLVGLNDYPPEFYRDPRQIETQVKNTEGYRRHAESNLTLARLILQENDAMPVLGICAGPQLMNIVLGGKLVQHLPDAEEHIAYSATYDKEHPVAIKGGRILADLFENRRITVNTNHHQAVHPDFVGQGLQPTAFADDGVIEAVEGLTDRFLLGVQWHPERVRDDEQRRKIFGAFIAASKSYRDSAK